MTVHVIGAGLAGCEAAWQLANAGISVKLYEMKPEKYTPAHKYGGFANLSAPIPLKRSEWNLPPACSKRKCGCWVL